MRHYCPFGGIDVLEVRDVPRPVPAAGEVLVQVRAARINPSEGAIRSGALHHLFPATFPSGQGSDLAGVVAELGPGVSGITVGDEEIYRIGLFSERRARKEIAEVRRNVALNIARPDISKEVVVACGRLLANDVAKAVAELLLHGQARVFGEDGSHRVLRNPIQSYPDHVDRDS